MLFWLSWDANFTSNNQPALQWFSHIWDVTFVESCIGFRDSVQRHVGRGAAPQQNAILVEVCRGAWGGSGSLFWAAPQGHTVSLSHRNSWTLQDNREPWEKRCFSATYEGIYTAEKCKHWTHWLLWCLRCHFAFPPQTHTSKSQSLSRTGCWWSRKLHLCNMLGSCEKLYFSYMSTRIRIPPPHSSRKVIHKGKTGFCWDRLSAHLEGTDTLLQSQSKCGMVMSERNVFRYLHLKKKSIK